MNLLLKGNYIMYQFSKDHINSLIFSIIVTLVLILIPIFFRTKSMTILYMKLLGYIFLIIMIGSLAYRLYIEKYPLNETVPIHLCNFSTFAAIFYLITRNKKLYNFIYYMFFTYIMVLIVSGNFTYSTKLYPYLFIFTHIMQLIALLLGKLYLNEKATKAGFYYTTFLYIILALIMRFIINPRLNTNYFYMNDYILDSLKFVKPMYIYQVLLGTSIVFSIFIMNLIRKK